MKDAAVPHSFIRIAFMRWTVSTNALMFFGLLLVAMIDGLLLNSPQTPYRFWLFISLVIVIVVLTVLAKRMSEGCRAITSYYNKLAQN